MGKKGSGMSKVFVIDTNKQPLNPLHPGRARLLLKQGKAAVYRRYPFTLILKRAVEQPHLEPLRVKIDPGSKTTGIALVNDGSSEVVWAAELIHRGEQIKRDMDKRRAVRKGNQDIHEFLKEQPERLARILAQAKTPLRDAAAVNATRWA